MSPARKKLESRYLISYKGALPGRHVFNPLRPALCASLGAVAALARIEFGGLLPPTVRQKCPARRRQVVPMIARGGGKALINHGWAVLA